MKPTITTIDGVRYVRARAIESEIRALDKALDGYDPANVESAQAVGRCMDRLHEAVHDPVSWAVETWAYEDHELELFDVPGCGEVLVPARGTGSIRVIKPTRGTSIRWRETLYLVKRVKMHSGGWAAYVSPFKESS